MIYLGDEETEECQELLGLLSVLFSRKKCPKEEMKILEISDAKKEVNDRKVLSGDNF